MDEEDESPITNPDTVIVVNAQVAETKSDSNVCTVFEAKSDESKNDVSEAKSARKY